MDNLEPQELAALLRLQAEEIASEGHSGWGNTMKQAEEMLAQLGGIKQEAVVKWKAGGISIGLVDAGDPAGAYVEISRHYEKGLGTGPYEEVVLIKEGDLWGVLEPLFVKADRFKRPLREGKEK